MIGSRDNIQYLIFYYLWWAISILHGSDALVMNTWRLNQLKFNFALQQDFFCSILLSFDELCNLIPPSTISSSSFSCLLATTPPPPSHFLPLLFFPLWNGEKSIIQHKNCAIETKWDFLQMYVVRKTLFI